MTGGQHRVARRYEGRHRKPVQIDRQSVVYPTFGRCQDPTSSGAFGSYAGLVGRVGALAMALGVGAAIATSHGMPVAHAEEPGQNTPADDDADKKPVIKPQSQTADEPGTATPSANPLSPLASVIAHALHSPARLPLLGRSQFASSRTRGSSDTETNAGLPGAVDAENVEQPTRRATPNESVSPTNFTSGPSNSVTFQPIHFVDLSATRPLPAADEPSAPITAISTVQLAASGTRQALAPGGPATAQSLATTTQTPSEQAVATLPERTVDVVTNFVASLLSPFVAPGPTNPASPPMLFAALAFVRREIGQSFFNQTPDLADNSVTTGEDTPTTINVLGNDTDADGDTLAVTAFTQPSHGTVVQNANGTFTYTPEADYHGTDSFTYTATDDSSPHFHGLAGIFDTRHQDTATVNITVTAVNDGPVAVDDSAGSVSEDSTTGVTYDVVSNDTDADGDTLAVTAVANTAPTYGTVSYDEGSVTYVPSATDTRVQGLDDTETLTDTFTYDVSDGNGGIDTATVTVTITGANDAPVGVADDAGSVSEDATTGVRYNVLANDSDVDGENLSVHAVTQGAHGTVVNNGDGTVTYIPGPNAQALNTGQSQTDSFTYTVTDGTAYTVVTVTVIITGVTDVPINTCGMFFLPSCRAT